jgi:hypothetical protein
MPFTNNNGQTRVGVRISPLVSQVTASTLWNSIYSVYNADWTASSSLKTSLYAVYNGELNTNDSYGSNNGTAIGGLTYSTGKIGNSFKFNGTNAYVSLPDNSLNFTGDFSISLWLYHTASGNQEIISSFYYRVSPYSYSGWRLMLDNILGQTNKIGFFIPKSGATSLAYTQWDYKTTSLTLNAWNHIVIVRKSGVDTLAWVNGISQAYNLNESNGGLKTQDPTYSGLEKSSIGVAGGSTNFSLYMKANSQIDGINIWNRALTESEITELYNSGNGSQYISGDFYKPTTSDSLYLNNGTAVGGLTYVPGKVGTAFNFNGTDAYVNMGDVMNVGLSSWSYGMWFNVNNISSTRILFSKTLSGENTGRIRCSVTTGGVIRFAFAPTNTASTDDIDIQTTNTISLNTWYHVVFVLDRTNNMKIYLNGVLQSVTVSVAANNLIPYSGVNFNNINPFRIGSATGADNTSPTGLFSGQIDAFNVWDRVLTQSEITELYNSGNGVQYSNPLSPLLLDSYYGAAAAYSLRKLKNSWTGSAIKVRRSNDNVEQNIGFDASGNLDTTALTTFVGANNISLYSEELDNAYWIKKLTTVTSNQTTAPDGTMTADLVSETIDGNTHGISPNYASTSFPAGTNWNISCYVKKGPGANAPNTFGIGFAHGLNLDTTVLFSFSTVGEIDRYVYTNDSNVGSSMVSVGNGWWRCSVWGTTTVTSSKVACGSFRFNNNSNILSPNAYVGKTDADIYIWGWQFSKGLNDTSVLTTQPYMKTTATEAGNGYVSTWYDQSGNGRDTIQATATNQPQIVVNGTLHTVNSKPAIKWSSSSTLALASTLNLTTQTYFVVNKNDSNLISSSTYQVISTGDASGTMSTAVYSYGNVTTSLTNKAISNIVNISGLVYGAGNGNTVVANQHLNNFKYLSDGSTEIWLDNTTLSLSISTSGTRPYSNTAGGNYPRTFTRIGNNSAKTNGLVGSFQEFIIYPSNMNIISVNNNINSYYSIY